ncbi:hypothetical protein [Arthrobacter sp. SLBN-112]|uniref:hypothetical protein n=1 Tax=Arthrobacter sp. SLBN-112 TaxID=2768452 RepID=UPI0028120F86|nr:hypothetical protein [Arthrobacter sp. SLBN-112]
MTLIAVPNPWMDASPDPETSQSEEGVPGSEFSQATALATGGVQASAWAAGAWESVELKDNIAAMRNSTEKLAAVRSLPSTGFDFANTLTPIRDVNSHLGARCLHYPNQGIGGH